MKAMTLGAPFDLGALLFREGGTKEQDAFYGLISSRLRKVCIEDC